MKNGLQMIPGIGSNMEEYLAKINIYQIADLKGRDPEELYERSCFQAGMDLDRCVLYVYRLAVYYAEQTQHDPEKLKWWYWKDHTYPFS